MLSVCVCVLPRIVHVFVAVACYIIASSYFILPIDISSSSSAFFICCFLLLQCSSLQCIIVSSRPHRPHISPTHHPSVFVPAYPIFHHPRC
ncbi:hypothetical protein FA15DRAFT_84063 [Coprinopsis marcescibilis]|uniref:Uncharacterized protein n=1 Tax=Coprinopsis marcescibilis TaxID=230819 RepID=A0A5C3KM36_COPMA|nr:hypothetical protein FA15DRAFT_84063 [Coprinopsis marcescibilis]